MEGSRFAFGMSRENSHLQRIVNAALAAIPLNERLTILRRWSASQINMPGQHLLQFTIREQRWLALHPRVKVAAVENFLPMSFFDAKGDFRGIGADVLAKISLRTGLKFDVVRGDSLNQQIDLVRMGKADLLAAITPSTEREGEMRFTRPYLTTPFVLVSRTQAGSPGTLDEMSGKKLALIQGNTLRDYIASHFPQVQIVYVDNAAQAMDLLATGKVEGAINSLLSARYMISRTYRDRLQVTSTVGEVPARISLATNRGALELYSILDKALLSISPEEMGELDNRWHSEVVIDDSYWLRHRSAIIQGFFIAGVLLLVALAWIAYLRGLIRRREEAEVALINQLEFMRVLVDGTPHPIYVRDREGRMMMCNSGYLDAAGLSHEAAMDRTITVSLFADPAEALAYHAEYLNVMQTGVAKIQDRILTMADGRIITIYHWMLPYRNSKGVVIGMIAGWIDVSERQRLLGQVQEARNIADDANRAKTTFLATMSHEIRTPMNAVIGMLELALKKADQGVLDRLAIEVASGAAHGLLDLIGDILDIARIESGKLSLSPARANLRELVESVVRIFEGLARQKRLRLVLEFDSNANCDVFIDPLRFKQVVSNLLSNAIKFTAEGEVRLRVEVLPVSTQGHLSIRLQVKDSGIGICAEDQAQLFSPFSQASNNMQSTRTGSGLGLVISRTLCEMMGGELHMSSVLGEGTRIDMCLNLLILEALPVADEPVAEPDIQAQALNVLVIDDYPANRLLLSQQLGYLGHRVFDAEDGAHGLRVWRNNHFDVVITDCNMPIMNGYALARAIRAEEQERGGSRCLILGFTANAQPDEKDRCIDAGMDDCLFKPISLKELGDRLASVDSVTEPVLVEGGRPMQGPSIDLRSLEQLTLGDEASIRELLKDLSDSNREDLEKLGQVFFEQNVQGLIDLAHRVKGGARIVKAQGLILACEQLEAVCGADHAVSVLEQAVFALKQEMLALAQNLKSRGD